MPPMPGGSLSQQIQQQYAYLFQLAQMLNLSMQQLESGESVERQVAVASQSEKEAREQTAASLKSLIVKTADVVRSEIEAVRGSLSGTYVAQSDFGSYVEHISQEIEEDPTKIARYFKFASDIQAKAEKMGTDFSAYKTETEGYIRQGIVRYDGTVPVIGIAIGQDIQTTATGVETETGVFDEIDTRSNMSVWTTEKLSFYIGGQEAAYFSNGKLTVAQIATDRIVGAGKWDVRFESGVKFKWIGG